MQYSQVLQCTEESGKCVTFIHDMISQWKPLNFCQISTQTCMQKIQSYFICDQWEYDILKCGKIRIEKYKKKLKL